MSTLITSLNRMALQQFPSKARLNTYLFYILEMMDNYLNQIKKGTNSWRPFCFSLGCC